MGIALVLLIVFTAGMIAGAIALVSIASLREDKKRLSGVAPGRIARAGRLVTGLRVENPEERSPQQREADPTNERADQC